ncbi:MAG: hybrid sensor histidine kinase/response regulator, partial [Gemmatimonadales bacterium]
RAGDDAAIRARSGAVLERQVQHLVRLVDDLFDVARINHNRLALRRERVDLAEVLRQAVDGARPLVDALGHTLTVSIARVGMPLLADPVRLAQVFGNLLNNACKYTPTGGRIELAATVDDGHAVVRVRDSGAGIPGEMLSRIFESFVQLERSLERSHGGLGIGLTLVKRLVEMHGGSVSAASDGPDRGSEFVVRLPLLHAAADAKAVRNSVAPAVRARRILVVDDNRDGAESLAAVLRLSGHETALAHDGMEALAVGAAFRPELILLDIGLPRLDGFETCRAIRDSGWGADVNVVALTGWGQEAHRRRSEEAGFDAHLVKPVDHAALANLIADMAPGGSVEVREA